MRINRLGEMNENDFILANMYADKNVAIGGTLFPHKRIRKAT